MDPKKDDKKAASVEIIKCAKCPAAFPRKNAGWHICPKCGNKVEAK